MSGLGGIIDKIPELGNMVMAPIMGISQFMQDERAYAENQKRYDQGSEIFKGLIDSGQPGVQGAWDKYNEDLRYAGKHADWSWGKHAGDINQKAQDRYDRGMGYLKGAGEQERKDINQAFDSQNSSIKQDMQSRGLGSSTISSGVQQSGERQRSDAIGGLNERLRNQYLSTDASLSGDALNIASSLGQKGHDDRIARLYGRIGSSMSGTLAPMEYGANSQKDLARWIGGREDIYPSESNFLNIQAMQGQAMAPAYEAPKAEFDWLSPSAGAAGSAATVATTKAIAASGTYGAGAVMCVDADSFVDTMAGPVAMRDVSIGDSVLTTIGDYQEIVAIDRSEPSRASRELYLRVVAGDEAITLTNNHILGGKPAGAWCVGDRIACKGRLVTIHGIEASPDVDTCCDLLLENGGDYIANGFDVGSMFIASNDIIQENARRVAECVGRRNKV